MCGILTICIATLQPGGGDDAEAGVVDMLANEVSATVQQGSLKSHPCVCVCNVTFKAADFKQAFTTLVYSPSMVSYYVLLYVLCGEGVFTTAMLKNTCELIDIPKCVCVHPFNP